MTSLFSIFSLIQFFFAVVIGLYFWNLLSKQRSSKRAIKKESKKELQKLHMMRQRSLTKPLSEKLRPKSFSEIVGQENGIEALQAALCGPNPQHVIIYGPPGVGKTAAARLVLEEARRNYDSPFNDNSRFVELDATTARFDERGIADPLIGSVHDPIYQVAGAMGSAGIPQPKPGAVTKAHGGILFIDEIGELHHIQMNKLLKVLEDRKVFLESSYYHADDKNIPRHIHDIFQNGLPADFRLIAATTKQPSDIPPAIRSRCLEIFFELLAPQEIEKIALNAVEKMNFKISEGVIDLIKQYAFNGRQAVNLMQTARGIATQKEREMILESDVEKVIMNGHYSSRPSNRLTTEPQVGVVNGLAVRGANIGVVDKVEVVVNKVGEGSGRLNITGVVEEEEHEGRYKKLTRKSMVKSSAENVVTLLQKELDISLRNYDIHIDFSNDAVVDGPSAGITMAVALYSVLVGQPVNNKVAMTGKISINGQVSAVGGIVPKVEAAMRAGAEKILLPQKNWKEIFNSDKFSKIEIVTINSLQEAVAETLLIDSLQRKNCDLNLNLDSFSVPSV
ncbi:ATP-dependent protease LonB [Halanaerobacter jeridensis]|uniref:endopeptidase La n=1 Tax=Halanaerobacter jeridensis TaxID=706427 RepID=A0A939BP18_9FIRM|nr:ATP-dependent protease LonB [Halanaerobacter jeridensis]MBM7556148.1 Lon-like ATP-dependent protease [Halanaerobacter jeridensis]